MKSHLVSLLAPTLIVAPIALGVPRPGGPGEPEIDFADIQRQRAQAQAQAPLEAEKRPFLGIAGQPISRELQQHLKLEAGLIIRQVGPNSAAGKAGLKELDIITAVDQKAVGSQTTLATAISDKKPGDNVSLSLIRNGEPSELEIELGEAPGEIAALNQLRPHHFQGGIFGQADQAAMDNLMRRLEDMQQRMHGNFGFNRLGPFGDDLNFDDLFEKLHKPGGINFQFGDLKESSTYSFRDENGSITISGTGDQREIKVTDPEGKIVYEGAYVTPQDKAAVPPHVQDRLEGLNLDEQPAFRFGQLQQQREEPRELEFKQE